MGSKTSLFCDWCGGDVLRTFAAKIDVAKQGVIQSRTYDICGGCLDRFDKSIAAMKANRHR